MESLESQSINNEEHICNEQNQTEVTDGNLDLKNISSHPKHLSYDVNERPNGNIKFENTDKFCLEETLICSVSEGNSSHSEGHTEPKHSNNDCEHCHGNLDVTENSDNVTVESKLVRDDIETLKVTDTLVDLFPEAEKNISDSNKSDFPSSLLCLKQNSTNANFQDESAALFTETSGTHNGILSECQSTVANIENQENNSVKTLSSTTDNLYGHYEINETTDEDCIKPSISTEGENLALDSEAKEHTVELSPLQNEVDEKDNPTFTDLSQERSSIDKLETLVVPEAGNHVENYIHIIDLTTEPPPPASVVTPQENLITEDSKDKFNNSNPFESFQETEGKPSLLKILPIKNGHGLWSIEELRLLLEDNGSVLLRLCAAPEAGNEDIIEGPQADFTALLLEDNFHIPQPSAAVIDHPDDDFMFGLPPSLMERLNVPPSLEDYEEYVPRPFWKHKEPKIQSTPKRKTQPTRGGRKRGRPPLHSRPWIPKVRISPPEYSDEPIKFRPPTPPALLTGDGSKSMGILEAALSKTLDPNFRKSAASNQLPNVKKVGNSECVSNRRTAVARKNDTEEQTNVEEEEGEGEEDFLGAISDEPCESVDDKSGIRPKRFVLRIPCPHCPLQFRKKAALTGHMRLRHKLMKKCPICNESIRVKGKYGMKFHILKAHKDENTFKCETCQESFKMHHHLKNHTRLVHEFANSSDDNSERFNSEKDEEEEEEEKNVKTTRGSSTNEKKKEVPTNKNTEESLPSKKDEEDSSSVKSETTTRRLRSQTSAMKRDQEKKRDLAPEVEERGGLSSGESGNESDDEGGSASSSESEIEEKKKYFCDYCDVGFSHFFKLRHHNRKKHPSGLVTPKDESLHNASSNQKKSKGSNQPREDETPPQNSTHKPPTVRTRGSLIAAREPSCTQSTKNERSLGSKCPLLRGAEAEGEEEEESDSSPLAEKSSSSTSSIGSGIPSYIVRKGRYYFCTKCNLTFKKEKQMVYHLKKIHEALYPFRKCPHCPRVFRSSGPYTRHLSQHNGRRCPIEGCKAKYKVLKLIKKHQRHAHPEFPHRCARCIELFAKESELERHVEEVHKGKKRERGKDDDGEEDEDEEEDETEERDGETEEKEDEEVNKNKNKISKAQPPKENFTKSVSQVRRSRATNISYKEDDDDDDDLTITKEVVVAPFVNKTKFSPPPPPPPPPPPLSNDIKKPVIASQSNPLKNLREALMMQSASKGKQQDQASQGVPEGPVPLVRPKRKYVRRAPYKKRKVDNSWTASLKSQYEGYSSESAGLYHSPRDALNPSPSSLPVYSPAITADVVRRVAESLLSKHQEQQQKQQVKHQKQLMRQQRQQMKQKRNMGPSFISYGANSSQLPRVSYSSLMGSRDNSLSSFDDSSHAADQAEFFSSPTKTTTKVPDDDDSGPAKILRFDSF